MGCLTAVSFFIGVCLLIPGIIGIKSLGQSGFDGVASYFFIPTGIILLFLGYKQNLKFKNEIEQKNLEILEDASKKAEKNIELENIKQSKILINLNKLDDLKIKLSEIQEIKISDISDFKKVIMDNEKEIIDKGGDDQLFSFIKIDSFLKDYKERIVNDQKGLNDLLDINFLKSRINQEGNRNDLDKIVENLEDKSAKLEGRMTKGFDANIDKLFDLGNIMKPVIESQIKTMEYYKNMSCAMIVFYLNDNKFRYFEIYEAFEKLGVFDSTWQKNVLNKLERIDLRLAQISNQLTDLNQNFISLVESSENLAAELKEINSSIVTNNMLQAITAYQTWRINNNTK